MFNRVQKNKPRQSLEQQLETTKASLTKLQAQVKRLGSLYVPGYKQAELEELLGKVIVLEKQITAIQKRNLLFRLVDSSNNTTHFVGDLLFSRDRAVRQRQRYKLRSWCAKLGSTTLKFVTVSGGVLLLLLIFLNYVQPAPTVSSTATLSPLAVGNLGPARVVNTGGIGVHHRTAPRLSVWDSNGPREGETVYLIERITNDQDELWWKVQEKNGRIGYIMDQFLQKQ